MKHLFKFTYIITLVVFTLSSCNQNNQYNGNGLLCSCFVFSPRCELTSYYIEIYEDGKINTTFGQMQDSLYEVIYNHNKLFQDKNFFLAMDSFSYNQYDKLENTNIVCSGPVSKDSVISPGEINKLISQLDKLPTATYVNHTTKGTYWDFYLHSTGIVLMVDNSQYIFWEDSCSVVEKDIYGKIKKISPIKIKLDLNLPDEEYVREWVKIY